MYQFEKILKDNGIAEDNAELAQSITKQIKQFRRLEKIITDNPDDIAGNEEREGQLAVIDDQIMKTLPDQFEIEDEAEEIAKAEKAKKELAEKQKIAEQKEKEEKEAIAEKERLSAQKAEEEKEALVEKERLAEQATLDANNKIASELKARAEKVNLPGDSSEAEIVKAEAKAAAIAEELKKPATTDHGALEKLFQRGHKTVTITELKNAGFDTGFLGPIGMHGCTCGKYRIYRANANSSTFELLKA